MSKCRAGILIYFVGMLGSIPLLTEMAQVENARAIPNYLLGFTIVCIIAIVIGAALVIDHMVEHWADEFHHDCKRERNDNASSNND